MLIGMYHSWMDSSEKLDRELVYGKKIASWKG
jgi:hypothetical protein